MKKGAINISISTIIILIIAIVLLGIIIGFITDFFPKIFETIDYPDIINPATANDPITFLPANVQRGKRTGFTISFYNNEMDDIPNTVKPEIYCDGISSVDVSSAGINIPVGEVKEYRAIVTVPKTTEPGEYSCSILISETEDTMFLTVK